MLQVKEESKIWQSSLMWVRVTSKKKKNPKTFHFCWVWPLHFLNFYIQQDFSFFLPSTCVSHVAQHICALSWACRCDLQQTELYSEMLLTDRFHSSHRLEWLCLFLGCGLGQWLVLNSRCFSAEDVISLQGAGVARRGQCSFNGTIVVFFSSR